MFKISYIFDLVDKVSPQLKKIQSNLQSTANNVKSSAYKIGASFDHIKNKLSGISKKSGQIGKDLFIRTTAPLGLLAGTFVKAASDYAESINKVEVAFGSAAGEVKKFAESAGKNFGINRGAALDMAAMFGDMSTSMGLSVDKAADLSTSLVGLAGDLASFKNIGVDQAQTALAGIFTGETESLKRLGIVMTETNLQQFALTQGIRKKVNEMRQDEKVLLRYNYIMRMSANSQGDFLRTQEGFANQFRILQSRFKDLSITLGSILLPYAIKLVNALVGMIEKFQALSPSTQKTILVIAGLVAVLAPLLIAIGFIGSGITALIAGFALLATPITALIAGFALLATPVGAIAIAFIAAGAAIYALWDDMKLIYDFIKDKLISVFDSLGQKINGVKEFLGFGGSVNLNQNLIQNPSSINQNQSFMAGGQLDVNFKGLPQGASANFTPAPKNFMNVGLNTSYAGL